jgi:hypothetical protein
MQILRVLKLGHRARLLKRLSQDFAHHVLVERPSAQPIINPHGVNS